LECAKTLVGVTPDISLGRRGRRSATGRPAGEIHRMSRGRPGSGVSMWQGMRRSLCVSRAALGTTYILWSGRSAASGAASGAAPAVAGILGTRHLVQALLTADQPTSAVLLLGAEADAAHAASMAGLAVMSGRWRRYALGDALIAASLAAVGLTCAANAPASDPRRDRKRPGG
jgi:hypothetical protein